MQPYLFMLLMRVARIDERLSALREHRDVRPLDVVRLKTLQARLKSRIRRAGRPVQAWPSHRVLAS
jgi:hypothetical protein